MTFNPNLTGIPPIARSAARSSQNNTGSTIPKGTPVKVTSVGVALVNVSLEADVDAIAGVTRADISNLSQGDVAAAGLIENITTSFSTGDAVYISKTGILTNIKPSIGVNSFVAGDFVVRVGVIATNTGNILQKDLLVSIQLMGQL